MPDEYVDEYADNPELGIWSCEHCGTEIDGAEAYDTEVGILCPDCFLNAVQDNEIDDDGKMIESQNS